MEELNVSSPIGYTDARLRKFVTPSSPIVDFHTARDAVVRAGQRAPVELSLALLWKELSLGLCRVVDAFFTETRCFLVTLPAQGAAVPIEGRRLQILEAVLAGEGQKRVAIELGLAPSTVALNARLALSAVGIATKPSRAHPLLMLAARAARVPSLRAVGTLSFLELGGSLRRVVSIVRPDLDLDRMVPPAELAVVRSLIEGATYEEIAKRRGTSTRTVANQITAVFRRLKVSGRSELLLRLFAGSIDARSATGAYYETIAPPEEGSSLAHVAARLASH
jgi:DNA-binding NarL/FixJ family response regulator